MSNEFKEKLSELVSKIKRESRNNSNPIPSLKVKDSKKIYKRKQKHEIGVGE